MEQTIFCENLKKFRLSKNYTQEQVANNLEETTESIRQHGMLVPGIARPREGGYEIIAGHAGNVVQSLTERRRCL